MHACMYVCIHVCIVYACMYVHGVYMSTLVHVHINK
jgi:hypothetical protein